METGRLVLDRIIIELYGMQTPDVRYVSGLYREFIYGDKLLKLDYKRYQVVNEILRSL